MSEQALLQILLGEFYHKLNRLHDLVPRDIRFPQASNKIKVAIGMRRTGKTCLIYQHIQELLAGGIDRSSVLYINFEDDRLIPFDERNLGQLVDAFYTLYPQNHERQCYFFFDEIQNISNWPLVIRRLHDTKNAEIFLTGSSAKMLSKEISTNLRGRSIATEVWPFHFDEFLKAHHVSIDRSLYDRKTLDSLNHYFQRYLVEGGFPEVSFYSSDERQKTLQDYIDVVIYRDIIERHHIKNPSVIKYMILSMIHNVAKPFTINKFYNDLKSRGYSTSKDLLYDYADHIEDAYLAFSVEIYDPSIRKVQTNPKKLYAVDPGLVRALTLDFENDLGRVFENIVYLDLRRRGCKVNYYLTHERYEVDFLAQTPQGEKKFFQVAWDMDDPQTREREERALRSAMQEMEIQGEIVTLDSYLRKGVQFDRIGK